MKSGVLALAVIAASLVLGDAPSRLGGPKSLDDAGKFTFVRAEYDSWRAPHKRVQLQ